MKKKQAKEQEKDVENNHLRAFRELIKNREEYKKLIKKTMPECIQIKCKEDK